MSVEILLLRGMFYAMEFFMGNSNVCIIIYCQNRERSMAKQLQERKNQRCYCNFN